MVFTLLLPIIQMTTFVLAIGHDPVDMKIAVKNYELKKLETICPNTTGCIPQYLSCRYLKRLEEKSLIMVI